MTFRTSTPPLSIKSFILLLTAIIYYSPPKKKKVKMEYGKYLRDVDTLQGPWACHLGPDNNSKKEHEGL
jgi:hypothetical protein